MRLAIFLPSLAGGGAERVMLNLLVGFVAKGLDVDLVLAHAHGPYLARVPGDVRVFNLNASRVLFAIPGLVRYLRKEKPVALLSALDHANAAAFLAQVIAGQPVRTLGTIHSTLSCGRRNSPRLFERLSPIWIRMLYPLADHLVAVSEGAADDFARSTGLGRQRISVVYNPVITKTLFSESLERVDHPWFLDDQIPIILSVGRLSWQKRFDVLIHAFATLSSSDPAKLVILGEGPERLRLEALVKRLGLEKEISLPGFLDNPYKYMKHADVFVLSSEWEGLPTVLIEAIALGTPVISTDCPSGPREIMGAKSQWLVPVGDVAALASAIEKQLASPERMTINLQRYSPEAAVTRYLEILGLA